MNKKIWLNHFYRTLENKKTKFHPSDFKFYNIARLPILADKTILYSSTCPQCMIHIKLLEKMADELPECLDFADTRKKFVLTKDKIESHLKKEHRLRFATYYSSLYTFLFAMLGAVIGLLIARMIKKSPENLILIFLATGMISGYLFGKMKDHKKYRQNQQL
ncbi:MAG: hypothetical protein JXB24_03880 [Bacteroidales bacterium]|nr:hypothetical protein [Bacteroidales bacterium]